MSSHTGREEKRCVFKFAVWILLPDISELRGQYDIKKNYIEYTEIVFNHKQCNATSSFSCFVLFKCSVMHTYAE